jgi:hypothetical protein
MALKGGDCGICKPPQVATSTPEGVAHGHPIFYRMSWREPPPMLGGWLQPLLGNRWWMPHL